MEILQGFLYVGIISGSLEKHISFHFLDLPTLVPVPATLRRYSFLAGVGRSIANNLPGSSFRRHANFSTSEI